MAKQLELDLPKWGGKRREAGRPRIHDKPGLIGVEVPHRKRAAFSALKAVHVTQRVRAGVGHLRRQGPARLLMKAFADAAERNGMRIVHFSIQSNHLHLVIEAAGDNALSRGMQGLAVRIARRLNARLGRRGPVFVDRFHSHLLGSRREIANAVHYVIDNHRHHARQRLAEDDPLATTAERPLTQPRLWLLRVGWRSEAGPAYCAGTST
jgi:REP element-mobilizing transposase RayT